MLPFQMFLSTGTGAKSSDVESMAPKSGGCNKQEYSLVRKAHGNTVLDIILKSTNTQHKQSE